MSGTVVRGHTVVALFDLRDLLVFIMFLVVTCLLVASVTSPDVYHLNQAIKKTFVT